MFRSLAAISAAALLAACNPSSPAGDGGSNAHGTLIDPCSLVTQAEAEAIMGKPVTLTFRDTTGGYITLCSYRGDVSPGYYLPTRLDIDAFTSAGVQAAQHSSLTAATYLASLKTNLPAGFWVPLSGIGSDAIWQTKVGKVSFYKGDVVVDVVFSPNGKGADTGSEAKSGAQAAALEAAARL